MWYVHGIVLRMYYLMHPSLSRSSYPHSPTPISLFDDFVNRVLDIDTVVVVHLRFMRSRFTSHFYFILNVLYGIFFYGNKRICRSPEVHIAALAAVLMLVMAMALKRLCHTDLKNVDGGALRWCDDYWNTQAADRLFSTSERESVRARVCVFLRLPVTRRRLQRCRCSKKRNKKWEATREKRAKNERRKGAKESARISSEKMVLYIISSRLRCAIQFYPRTVFLSSGPGNGSGRSWWCWWLGARCSALLFLISFVLLLRSTNSNV